MKLKPYSRAGFTLVEIMIVVAIVGLLAAIAIPNYARARTTTQQNACINNLRQVDGAIQQWALEFKKGSLDQVLTSDVTPYIRNPVVCPTGGTTIDDSYTLVDVATPTVCKQVPLEHILP